MTESAAPKKNVILFTGPNRVFRERDLAAWIRLFERKYGADQIVRLDVACVPPDSLRAELASAGLFAAVKLVILSGWASAQGEDKPTESEAGKSDPSSLAGNILMELADRIPDTTFVVVHAPALDRRSRFSKFLEKRCTVKLYEAAAERDVRDYAEASGLAADAARVLAERYRDDLEGAAKLLDTLALYRADGRISRADVEAHASLPAAESVFPVVDALLADNCREAADTAVSLLGRESVYALLASLVSNLRTAVLVCRLAECGMAPESIAESVKIHPFVLKKDLAARKHLPAFSAVYAALLDLDRRVKTGRIAGSDERGVELLLEACLRSRGQALPAGE